MDNMELWNKVCETDPKYTKKVTFGRSFTAIDPMHQMMVATEQLGRAGTGWGWEVMEHVILPTKQIAVRVRLWTETHDNYIEQWGQNGLYTDNNCTKVDGDCMKKATTDGLTKCLSYLGFNADIFLGKFDDNKYVQAMKEKNKEPKQDATPKPKEVWNKDKPTPVNDHGFGTIIDAIEASKDSTALEAARKHALSLKDGMNDIQINLVKEAINKRNKELNG